MVKTLRLPLALGVVLAVLGVADMGTTSAARPIMGSPIAPDSGRCQAWKAKSGGENCPGEIWMGGNKGCGCAPSGTCTHEV